MNDLLLYKELISFCNKHSATIENKFERKLKFDSFNTITTHEYNVTILPNEYNHSMNYTNQFVN